jgi:hypothetical protein
MKKIITLFFVAVFVQSFIVTVGISATFKSINPLYDGDDSFIIRISYPDFEIVEDKGKHTINMEGYNHLSEPGKPLLPSKKILIALPPDCISESVNIKGLNMRQVPGFYKIKPAPKILPDCSGFLDEKYLDEIDKEWNENYIFTYSSDIPYPVIAGEFISQGTYHKIGYVSVYLYPFVYHPASGKLFLYDSVEIDVNYANKNNGNLGYNKEIENEAYDLFINFDDVRNFYQPYTNPSSRDIYNYVIITSDSLYGSVIASNFVNWKSSIGFNMKIINITDSLITSQQGFDLAEQIRNFLRNNYADWEIKYVLLVGNYTKVPMRYCFPNRYNHNFNLSDVFGGEYPTDSYYADLSYPDADSWDSDGDGFYGEFRDDDPDFLTEICVGRIPTNNPDQVIYVLEKSMAFEMDAGDWKSNVLHAGAILLFNPFDDGAKGVDYIETELMDGMPISHYSEQEGVKTSDFLWDPLKEEIFTGDWKSGKYAIVNWFGHGWSNKVARWVWIEDTDGDNRADPDELEWIDFINTHSQLDDDYPSIIYAKSCVVGYPEPCPDDWPEKYRGNLGVDLLIKPSFGTGVAVMSATRVCYLLNYQWVTQNMGFEINKELIFNHLPVGDAFFKAKFTYCQNCTSDNRDYCNKFAYNLYGDPSLIYEGITVAGKPNKPLISGPEQGKPGEEYTYYSSTSDPDNDNIYYLFNWGDGSCSDWLGPYLSGEECNASHTWNKKGKYEIKVRVKDANWLFSDWSDPLSLNLPKSKVRNMPFLKFLENQPFLYRLLQLLLECFGLNI